MSSKRSKRFSYCLLSSLVLVHCVASYAATSDATQPATSQQIEIDRLIATASAWEIRSQPDRAREAIRKILSTDPQHPQALLMLGMLEIASNRNGEAQKILQRLQKAHPGHKTTKELAEAYRLAATDHKELQRVRGLLKLERYQEAEQALNQLFPEGPPPGQVGLLYYELMLDLPNGYKRLQKNLQKIAQQQMTDPRLSLVTTEFLVDYWRTRVQGLRMTRDLYRQAKADKKALLTIWRNGLNKADVNDFAYIPFFESYFEIVPDNPSDQDLRDKLAQLRKTTRVAQAVQASNKKSVIAKKDSVVATATQSVSTQNTTSQAEADSLSQQAQQKIELKQYSEASQILERAIVLNSTDPWLRYRLANVYAQLGTPQLGDELLAEGLTKTTSEDAFYAYALWLNNNEQSEKAQAMMDKISKDRYTPGMLQFVKEIAIQNHLQKALSALAQHDAKTLEEQMQIAEKMVSADANDANLAVKVASTWNDLGQSDQGIAYLAHWLAGQGADQASGQILDARIRYSEFLLYNDKDQQLQESLEILHRYPIASDEERKKLRELDLNVALYKVDRYRWKSRFAEAKRALDAMDPELQASDAYHLSRAQIHLAQKNYFAANEDALWVLQRNPNNLEALLLSSQALWSIGEKEQSTATLNKAIAQTAPNNLDARLRIIDYLIRSKQTDRAQQQINELHHQIPGHPDVYYQEARLAQQQKQYERAEQLLTQATSQETQTGVRRQSDTPGLSRNEEALLLLHERKQSQVATANYGVNKSGDEGISKLHGYEVPLYWRYANGYDGHWFGHFDQVHLDAGTVANNFDASSEFGKVAALGLNNLQGPLEQKNSGTMLAFGYQTDDWRVDIGTTPTNFPVHYVTGGLRLSGELNSISYTVNASRRPVTSSLLSFSGAVDPVSGDVWGGVRRTGVDFDFSYGYEPYRLFAAIDVGRLTGKNVLSNNELILRAGIDWLLLNKPDQKISLGFNASYWSYSENQRFYSFGQGGYYSPQKYLSFAIPVQWVGRAKQRLAYRLRAVASYSNTREDDVAYFPTDAQLQTQAEQLANIQNTASPFYTGGPGGGFGYSVSGALQYLITPNWVVGALFELDRSKDYEPNRFAIYLRYHFTDQRLPTDYPPVPVVPYSRY